MGGVYNQPTGGEQPLPRDPVPILGNIDYMPGYGPGGIRPPGSPRPGIQQQVRPLGNLGEFGPRQYFEQTGQLPPGMTVGDPRLGAPDVPGNSLQQIMRGGAANGGRIGYQMGGPGMQEQLMQSEMQPMQDQSMQSEMQSMQAPLQDQGQPQMDPNQAIEILVRMLMEQGIPQEEAIKIAMQMIQAVSEGGMQEVSDDTRIEARFGGRIGYANGGISRLVDREQYGLGSFFKGVTKAVSGAVKGVVGAVKKVASSDLGKLALAAAAIYAGGGGFGISPGGFSVMGTKASPGLLGSGTFSLGESVLGQQLLGTQVVDGIGKEGFLAKMGLGRGYGANPLSGISSLIPGKGNLISAGLGFLGGSLAGMQPPVQEPGESLEDYQRRVEEFKKIYEANLAGTNPPSLPAGANNPYYPVYAANGGRIGYQEGGMGNVITQATQEAFFGQPQMPMMSNGGRMGYAMGNSVQQGIMAAPQIANQMGMPVGSPRMNEGGVPELDYRDEGGFVPPIGIKERADDIPAMLSNNEFVFTADAVKNAGGGDPNVGAQKMYTLMKRLESGGRV
jgi:hypothetical protein